MKILGVALGIALSATVMSASAQKNYTSGVVTYTTSMRGQDVEVKDYFKPDSSAVTFTAGPATITILTDSARRSLAILIDVPVASIKKAAIANPDEIDQMMSGFPTFTFTPVPDSTKQISGFNCKKVEAKDNKTGKTYAIWVTDDVSVPKTAMPFYYKNAGGFPVQYTAFQQGQGGQMMSADVTVKSVSDDKAPAGTFAISSDFDKITMDDLRAMQGGGN
ncbi:MAG TPA: hypothetical protein VHC47_09385 [Mucilaginibacter sp.]|nr:hypothetical protein [Mucilaginibacter sp.]